MKRVFADTSYWVALLNNRDQGHAKAQAVSQGLQASIITTQEVLSEVLTYFCGHGPHVRRVIAAFIRNILSDPAITVLPQSTHSFLDGLTLYENRPDKGYSLVDCVSMSAMHRETITHVLTDDDHFAQEGFIKLL